MSDNDLLAAFESCSLPKPQWTHAAHVRVAFLYICRWQLDEATDRIRAAITSYNAVVGVNSGPQSGYHETTTRAFMRLIDQAVRRRGPFPDSYQFCEHNPQLMDRRVLLCYYTRDCITTPQAKLEFVEPDIAPLDRLGLAYPEFGRRLADASYTLRPGGYGVIENDFGQIAVAATPTGLYLPGGAQESNESAVEALHREAQEECGLAIQVICPLGMADELVYSKEENQHFCKRCTFYSAMSLARGPAQEPDHRLEWMAADAARQRLSHGSQRWAVSRRLGR